MRIGELARRTGVSVRSLRYYEQQRMLHSSRTAGGQRVYDEGAVDRVELIQVLFGAGSGSRDVVDLLECIESGVTTSDMLDRLVVERERLDRQAKDLAATRRRLDEVIGEARARMHVSV